MNPEVLMLDEVTSALDPSLVSEVLDVIAGLKHERRTLLIVTHHIEFAKAVADDAAFLWGGRIHEHGKASVILNEPATEELRGFLRLVEKAR
jgi:polar amino acid transport system ATP-binding protein